MVRGDCVNFDIEPELGVLRLDDVNIGPVNWTHTARGKYVANLTVANCRRVTKNVTECRKVVANGVVAKFVLHSALRTVSQRTPATYQPIMRSCDSL